MSEELRKKALDLEVKKRFEEAAAVYYKLGLVDKAAFMYQKANKIDHAVEILKHNEQYKKAADICVKAGKREKAAALYEQGKEYALAAKEFVQCQLIAKGAEMYEKAGSAAEAAKLYMLLKDFMKAGQLYEQAGDLMRSAMAYECMVGSDEMSKVHSKDEMTRIARILEKVKNFEKAAEIYIHGKEIAEAVVMYMKIGEIEAASRIYSNCQGDLGYEIMNNIPDDGKSYADFASMFMISKDYAKAAYVYEQHSEFVKAGDAYFKCDDYHMAAEAYYRGEAFRQSGEMFEKAGNYESAAELFEKIEHLEGAAKNYERCGKFFKSGAFYLKTEKYDKAIELLQKVKEGDQDYLEASRIVTDILQKKGYVDLAIDRYNKVVSNIPINDDSIDFYYNLARIKMEKRQYEESEKLLKEVVGFKFGYKDASEILQQVSRQKDTESRAGKTLEAAVNQSVNLQDIMEEDNELKSLSDELSKSMIVARMEGFEFLKQTNLFENLTLDEMKQIWEICDSRVYNEEDYIIKEGEAGKAFYIIKDGSVRITKSTESEEEIVAVLTPGEHFGEISLVTALTTTANVVAAEQTEVFAIYRDKFEKLMDSDDKTALKMHKAFIKTLSERLTRTSSDFAAFRTASH